MSYAEKVNFTNQIKELSSNQLGDLVKILREKCPHCLKETENKEDLQIVVDNISKPVYDSLLKWAHEKLWDLDSTNEQEDKN